MKFLFILPLILFLIFNCSRKNDLEVIKTNNITRYINRQNITKELNLNFSFAYEINEKKYNNLTLRQPLTLDVDSKNNLFILDKYDATIKKFNIDGKFIRSFGKKGPGPGEMEYANAMIILEDTIYVTDAPKKQFVRFDTNGNFIDKIRIPNNKTLLRLESVGGNKIVGLNIQWEKREEGIFRKFSYDLMDKKISKLVSFYKYEYLFDKQKPANYLDFLIPFTVTPSYIFVPVSSSKEYKVNIYNHSGELKKIIEKPYRRIKFNKQETVCFDSLMLIKNGGDKTKSQHLQASYKKSINGIYYDKYNRLLIANSIERNDENQNQFWVDIYKDFVLLGKAKLDFIKGYDFLNLNDRLFFRGNKLFYLSISDATIKVYNY
ncbi:MAG: hypothetical protein CSA15_03240 [Candidatus Delongbacteria bacterium]|nr:MAG: hypothetical protein CSA15_03240 [Candidatus Delongbacteria bacterium]